MVALSVLIPARCEQWLGNTIQDILTHSKAETEVICVLDGSPALTLLPEDGRVRVVQLGESIGQRAATNLAAKMSSAKYLMKVDAHCAFDDGFDTKMLVEMHDDWTMVPVMRNLHVFDWVCPEGHRRYQGPSGPCQECGQPTTMDIKWIGKTNPQSTAYCFDAEPHFQYFGAFKKRPEGQGDLTETMSLQGSCWMLTREKYWELGVCNESWGSWGSQGIEVAVKTWLSGGRVICNHKTWYAHCFRTQGGDFGFPYPMTGKQVDHAKRTARDLFFNNKWPKQIHNLSWLVEKFWPVPGWTDADLAKLKEADKEFVQPIAKKGKTVKKGILYYTCNTHSPDIEAACRKQLLAAKGDIKLVSVSLNKEIDFGDERIVLHGERGGEMMHKQILAGLEAIDTDIVFLCESDVMYHPSHFDFVPPREDTFYYNSNLWKLRYEDGLAVWTDDLQQVSGCCASREVLWDFYKKRVDQIVSEGFNRHYEPGSKQTVGSKRTENWMSAFPNLDIRHDKTLTKSKWSPDQFRNQKYAKGWKTATAIVGWGETRAVIDRIKELM